MEAPATGVTRFPISFESWYQMLSTVVAVPPSSSYLDVDQDQVHVQMGWAFRSRFPRSSVVSTSILEARPVSRGVHGFAGRWLVNGSGSGILSIDLSPVQRGHVLGFPVRLRQLLVSVADPSKLAAALRR